MAAYLIESLYLSGVGSAAASGTLNFYQVGTLVAASIYADDSLVTTITQPIVLDANGKSPLPLYSATPLRAIIKSQAGATLFDVARVDGHRAELVALANASFPGSATVDAALTALATSFGGTNGNFLASGSGAVPRTFQSVISEIWYSVKSFGAVGNGIADDTTACQAAITACAAANGGVVYFPPGTYLNSSALSITAGMKVSGAPGGSTVKQSNASANGFTVNVASTPVYFDSLTISHSTTSSGTAIAVTNGIPFLNNVRSVAFFESVLTMPQTDTVVSASIVNSYLQSRTAASAAAVSVTGTTHLLVSNSQVYAGATGTAVTYSPTTNAVLAISSSQVGGAANGIAITRGYLLASSTDISGSSSSLNVGASTDGVFINYDTCRLTSSAITDSRTGAPVNFSLGTSSAVTPTPLLSSTTRILATAAITVTVNGISATGWGRKWTLMCLNNSGAGVTWSFNAQYKLSAAVSPTTGNMVSLLLEYDPISGIVREVGRAATAI